MPRTGDATVDDLPFSQRTALMGADIGHRRDAIAIAEDGDALITCAANNFGSTVGNLIH
jgi:hypothetical protein